MFGSRCEAKQQVGLEVSVLRLGASMCHMPCLSFELH